MNIRFRKTRKLWYDESPPLLKRFVALVTINALTAAAASFYFVPLALHIYSCTDGKKWCHIQAFLLGAPSVLVSMVLLLITALVTLTAPPIERRGKRLRTAAWLLWSLTAVIIAALFGAVAHNSH